jgi:DNA-directed RNA polymerase subunit RPC12/RpoP
MIDESAHKVFDYGMKDWHGFRAYKCSHCSRQLDIYYCESRLYLVRCKHCRIVSLVEARNPNEAAEKVNRRTQQPNNAALDEIETMEGK